MKKLQLREHMKINLWKKFETKDEQDREENQADSDGDDDDDDDDCLLVNSEMEEPRKIHEALNGDKSPQLKEALESERSSLLKNDTWDAVPPPEGMNIVGSRWVLKVVHVTRMVL